MVTVPFAIVYSRQLSHPIRNGILLFRTCPWKKRCSSAVLPGAGSPNSRSSVFLPAAAPPELLRNSGNSVSPPKSSWISSRGSGSVPLARRSNDSVESLAGRSLFPPHISSRSPPTKRAFTAANHTEASRSFILFCSCQVSPADLELTFQLLHKLFTTSLVPEERLSTILAILREQVEQVLALVPTTIMCARLMPPAPLRPHSVPAVAPSGLHDVQVPAICIPERGPQALYLRPPLLPRPDHRRRRRS